MGNVMKMAGMVALLFTSACCNMGSSDVKPAPETRATAAAENKAAPNANPGSGQGSNTTTEKINGATPTPGNQGSQGAVVTPSQQTYPMDGIKTIADDCHAPQVILATAPKSVGANYPWHVTRQALLANQQFKLIYDRPPANSGEISVGIWGYNDGYAAIAMCANGATCNRLAAMYKAIVRSSRPQVLCTNNIQGTSTTPIGQLQWDNDPKGNLPKDGELPALCGRLNACMIASDQSTPGDPFLECQKAPAKFKTDCAKRYPCAEVIACMGK